VEGPKDGYYSSLNTFDHDSALGVYPQLMVLLDLKRGLDERGQDQRTGIGMAKPGFKSVDQYIASQPQAAQRALKRVRSSILKALPRAEEVISYNLPTYKLNNRSMFYFAGWKHHYSLYAATQGVMAAFQDDLSSYEVDKGTIRFPLTEPVPVKLIERIAKFRAREVADSEKAKSSGKKR